MIGMDAGELMAALHDAGALAVPVYVMHRSPSRAFAAFDLDGTLTGVILSGAPPPNQPQVLTGPQAKVMRQLDIDGLVPDHMLDPRIVTALASLNLVRLRGRNVESTQLGLRALDRYEEAMARRSRQA